MMLAEGVDELSSFLIEQTGIDECAEREEKQAGRGAYGFVFKVTVQGVERIGKKLHSAYVNNVSGREKQAITSRFRNECVILSKLRHPNIVQFIGVHYGRRGKTDLTLIMECVSSDMQEFIKSHPNLPLPVKLSILLDVSYGLVYLHEWDPNTPIVHRDLTARNVLITDKCQAKIADLGVAKVVDIQAQMADSHTQAPGQQLYMPPEALMEKASCTPKLDIFSFGHLTLFTVNQEFPKVFNIVQTPDIQRQGAVERLKRQRSIDRVGEDHCLYSVITDCLSDQPENRPTTRVLNNRMVHLSTLNPASVESVLEVFPSDDSYALAGDSEFRRLDQLLSQNQYLHELKARGEQLKAILIECDKYQKELADNREFVSKLSKEKERLEKEVTTKDNKIASLQQKLQERELISMAEVARVNEQFATASGDSSSADSAVTFQEHTKKQAKVIYDLQQKIEVLEFEANDGDSFHDLLREAEDERDKLREDFCSAREEINTLKVNLVDLENELQSSKMETLRLSTSTSERELPYQHQLPFRAGSQEDMDPQHLMSAWQPPPQRVGHHRPSPYSIASKPGEYPPTASIDTQTSLDFTVQQPGVSLATQTSIQGFAGNKFDVAASRREIAIELEIEAMVAVVQDEVSRDNKYKETQDMTPFDPNLVCPMCGKEHRIGEIQKFKIHVDQCGGKDTLI